MTYYQPNYNIHEPYNPGSQPVYMTDPAQGHNFQGDSQAVAHWLTSQHPNPHFLYPGAEHSVAGVNNPSIDREDREIGYLQRQYAQHERSWSQDTTASVQSGFVPSPQVPQPSMARPSPPLAPWSPSAPQYFGGNPNAFAPPPAPSPPPQAQAQGWVSQPHPQPAGGLGPSVVETNSAYNHVQDVGMQYGYAPQLAYAYPQPTENISAWEYAYVPEVVGPNYAGQAPSSFPTGAQQAYAGPELNYPHQHGTSFISAQAFHGAEHHPSPLHVQPTPHGIQGGAQSQSSASQQNYVHHCGSGCPEQASLTNVDDQMNSYSFPAATMITNQVPESAHHDGRAKKAPKRTTKPKRQTNSRSKKTATAVSQATATAPEIVTPSVCPPGTVDPKDVFSNPKAGRVARPRAAVVKRKQARAGVQAADRVPANSQATDEDHSNPALGDENLAPGSNSLDARAQAHNKLKLARLQEPVPLTYLPEVTGGEALCFLCSYPIKTGWKIDARSGKGHYRGDGFKWHQFNKERRFRCRPLVHLGVKELPDKSITNIDNLAVWLLIMHPKLAVTQPKPFHYAQLGKDVTRQLRWWWNKKLKAPQRARWIAKARM